ncbi:Redox-regulatory protein FAM213A [Portunus trituberculatus]|uniref:Peroxiredoxin-like 2A n=1 Tax=Portunus trituberculatus TaxID=210409 RepID=A0A5B7F0F1_PORTR|nr:Redox-regulatory protein FAM213A [Portunus trituberculatus]
MYALLHEELGAAEFAPYFKGDLLLDKEKRFYGPVLPVVTGMLRWSVWQNIRRATSKGVEGNLKGDGTLLGSVFLLGPGSQGILYEHREREFGDHHNSTELLEALSKLQTPTLQTLPPSIEVAVVPSIYHQYLKRVDKGRSELLW